MSVGEIIAVGFAGASAIILIGTLVLLRSTYTLVKKVEAKTDRESPEPG